MAPVEVRRTVPTALDAVWDALTDFAAYGRWIPLTSMRTEPGPARLGWAFGGFTGLGPVGFLDSMLVVKWEPPLDGEARFAVRKTGRVLRGWADVPSGRHRCRRHRRGLAGGDRAPSGDRSAGWLRPLPTASPRGSSRDALDGMLEAAATRATSS